MGTDVYRMYYIYTYLNGQLRDFFNGALTLIPVQFFLALLAGSST